MGVEFVDIWSVGHFIAGVVYRLVIFPDNWLLSFATSAFLHLLTALMENSVHPVTGGKEEPINHIGDMVFFLAGWVAGCFINPYIEPYQQPLWKSLRIWLLVIAMFLTIKEILREVIIINPDTLVSKILY